jgi:hypothetical protein
MKILSHYLDPKLVRDMIKKAEQEEEVIVVRCARRTAASKPGGPDADEFYDLHCTTKPSNYIPASVKSILDRKKEDKKRGVLTVYVVNRKEERSKKWGAWRRVDVTRVVKLIYKAKEYETSNIKTWRKA